MVGRFRSYLIGGSLFMAPDGTSDGLIYFKEGEGRAPQDDEEIYLCRLTPFEHDVVKVAEAEIVKSADEILEELIEVLNLSTWSEVDNCKYTVDFLECGEYKHIYARYDKDGEFFHLDFTLDDVLLSLDFDRACPILKSLHTQ